MNDIRPNFPVIVVHDRGISEEDVDIASPMAIRFQAEASGAVSL